MGNFVSNENATALFTKVGQKNADLLASIGLPVGTGKNLLDVTVASVMAANGGASTWSSNAKTINGVTFTLIDDGNGRLNGVKVNTGSGSASSAFSFPISLDGEGNISNLRGTFILSADSAMPTGAGLSVKMSNNTYDGVNADGAEKSITATDSVYFNGRVHIYISNGSVWNNVTIKPMIRPSGTSPDYVPYSESVEERKYNTAAAIRNGAHNLLENTANSRTIDGIAYTVNSDGTVIANNTATANSAIIVMEHQAVVELLNSYDGEFILSGCPSDGGDNKYHVQLYTNNGPTKRDNGNGVRISKADIANATTCNIAVRIVSGQTVSNLKFYPMLRIATDTDSTYVPYAMPNRELTEKVKDVEGSVSLSTGFAEWTINEIVKRGRVCNICLTFSGTLTTGTEVEIGTLDEALRPKNIIFLPMISNDGYGYCKMHYNGTVSVCRLAGSNNNQSIIGSYLTP